MPRGEYIIKNKIRILAVEDEAISALLLNAYLAAQGYECGEAVATGEEAVERAARENPDVVFMDIQLAGKMDGIEAARLIKRNRENTQIVFVTAYSDEETMAGAMKIDPLAYILKPFNIEELKKVIDIMDGRCEN